MLKTQLLYRPVGLKEMELIAESGFKKFPPRLMWQPIFYPVLNEQYASQIALDWNTTDSFSGFCGLVTAFNVNKDFLKKYEVQNVGGEIHNELWIPATELDIFNENIVGNIEIVKAYFGKGYTEPLHTELNKKLKGFLK